MTRDVAAEARATAAEVREHIGVELAALLEHAGVDAEWERTLREDIAWRADAADRLVRMAEALESREREG